MTDQTLGKRKTGGQAPKAIRFPAFRPRRPWLGGDLQTLRNPLVARFAPDRLPSPDGYPETRLAVPLSDGSGTNIVRLHQLHQDKSKYCIKYKNLRTTI